MWGLERLGVPIPDWVALGIVVVSATLLLLAAVTAMQMFAIWLRKRGRGRLGQLLIFAVGCVFVVIGIGAVLYALMWFTPDQVIAKLPPSQEIGGQTFHMPERLPIAGFIGFGGKDTFVGGQITGPEAGAVNFGGIFSAHETAIRSDAQ